MGDTGANWGEPRVLNANKRGERGANSSKGRKIKGDTGAKILEIKGDTGAKK